MLPFRRFWKYIMRLPRKYTVFGGVALIVVITLSINVLTRSEQVSLPQSLTRVQISSVTSLSSQAGPLPVTGKVTSLSEATILAQSSGEIISLNRQLGDSVAAGQVIALLENSSQQAAVQQAQGAYDAAQAALAKASGSTAANSSVTSATAQTTVKNATVSANAALRSAYATLDDVVRTKSDLLISNPRSASPVLNFAVSNSQLTVDIQNQRTQLEGLLASASTLGTDPSAGNVGENITSMIAKAQVIERYLDDLVEALNKAIPTQNVSATTIATYQTTIGSARSSVIGVVTTLTTAKGTYDAAVSSATTASNSATSGTANDIAVAQANAQAALGALNAAKANLEKTVIRSPISGRIVTLSISRGDYVSAFSKVAQISNPSALQVETYVTPSDAKTLSVGGKAMIENTVPGTIVSIAPAIDPSTNKIQVKVGIVGDQSALTDGESVTLALDRAITQKPSAKKPQANKAITIPIESAKILPSGPVVFTVSSSTLVAVPVELGPIVGDQVTITSGLTPEMAIVTDARGLVDGQAVVVDDQ